MKKVIALIIIASIAGGIYFFVNLYLEDKNAWKLEVVTSYIKVREEPGASSYQIGTVYIGEILTIKEINQDDPNYVWYNIEYKGYQNAWVSSSRNEPFVKEINGINSTGDTEEPYFEDYKNPVIRYNEDIYTTLNLSTINYNHIEVEEDSKYTITHEIYYEEKPKDSDIPQYWIKYYVEDEHGNKASKVQRIIFEETPNTEDVLLFKDMN